METASIVQASANVIRITKLKQGDVYKRLIEQNYGVDKYKMVFGIVQDVMFNGTDGAITAIEFDYSWTSMGVSLKTFGTGADLQLFAATPEEVRAQYETLVKLSRQKRDEAIAKLAEASAVVEQVELLATGATKVTAPETVDSVIIPEVEA